MITAGQIGILNVGAGDTKLVFDRSNPAELIRAGRIVRDMLRNGYALLIEVEGEWVRAKDFDETKSEYIIADLARPENQEPLDLPDDDEQTAPSRKSASISAAPPKKRGRKPNLKRVDASTVGAVAVSRTAGG